MPIKIVRNDITKMEVDAIVNTANKGVAVGPGCDYAVYQAAGHAELLAIRKKIGVVEEGEVFLTPGLALPAAYIIHAVSPRYHDGNSGEEEKLRACYRKSLELAVKQGIKSIAFPVIATGSFGYPLEEGMQIAMDEINKFLCKCPMIIYLVVFGKKATKLGDSLTHNLKSYIDQNYVDLREEEEYGSDLLFESKLKFRRYDKEDCVACAPTAPKPCYGSSMILESPRPYARTEDSAFEEEDTTFFDESHEEALTERMQHLTDTFSEYLIYLINQKGLEYPDVYKRAIVDKKVFSKIKNHPDAHPKKITAMCLCIGAMLNLDETVDLLARAGYALSPCDKTDIIFRYFIENHIYDMIELDIQLEEHGLPCLIA